MSKSFLDYSMSVIISRALPDARDGLKPSQRRILFAMKDLSLYPGRKHYKCAKICGDTSGNYHPHGEAVVYPTLVNMAQHWSMREPLIDGQGNFGSVEGDPPAAMRYTEARLTHLGAALMEDMEQDTVDFVPNYDERLFEPVVFPASFPNLLVNGGTGIAVGMATNIPPHNLGEVVDGVCAQIDNPDITNGELLSYIKGPDFPTGCRIHGLKGIRDYFTTGRGSVRVRGKTMVEEGTSGREVIVITEIPFNVNRATLVTRIAELATTKIIPEISAVRDESDENTRVVVELKREARTQVVINNLYNFTALESSFSVNMLAIDNRRPRLLSVRDAIACFIDHRREVIIRRTKFQLRKAREEAEILEAYLLAIANLDEFIHIIRDSANRDEARVRLRARHFLIEEARVVGILIGGQVSVQGDIYIFTERQVEAILNLRLYQLTALERGKTKNEYDLILDRIADLLDILANEYRVLTIIKDELKLVKAKYATPRKTEIAPDIGEINLTDLIANQPTIITITHRGNIKRTAATEFRSQRRGGKGLKSMEMRGPTHDEDVSDFVENLITASTHDYLMYFTNTGRVYADRVYQIPEMPRATKGRSIKNLLNLKPEEKIAAVLQVPSVESEDDKATWRDDLFVFFTTRAGVVKKTNLSAFRNIQKNGINALEIDEGDELIGVKLTSGNDLIMLATYDGKCVQFNESEVRGMGRTARGMMGTRPRPGDHVVALCICEPGALLLAISENGLGKRTPWEEYRLSHRGGIGVTTMKITDRTGPVVGALMVHDNHEVMLITNKGQSVRIPVRDIRITGRNAQGVKLMTLRDGEKLQDIARVVEEELEIVEAEELIGGEIPPVDTDSEAIAEEEAPEGDEG